MKNDKKKVKNTQRGSHQPEKQDEKNLKKAGGGININALPGSRQ